MASPVLGFSVTVHHMAATALFAQPGTQVHSTEPCVAKSHLEDKADKTKADFLAGKNKHTQK